MRKSLIALTAAGSLAAFAATATVAGAHEGHQTAALARADVQSGTYTTDPAHTLVEWRVSHFGFNDYFGLFGDAEGVLELDAENLANSTVDVRLPITSLAVVSEGLREHMLRPGTDGAAPDFFGPEPEDARFVSTAVHPTGEDTAHIVGDLTLNGQTKQIAITAELSGMGANPMNQKATLGFHGTTTIQRSDWGLDYGVPMGLGDEVTLDITVAFEQQ